MWILLLLLSAAVHTLASKEHVSLRDLPEDEKDILIELVKRLGQGNKLDQLGWKDTAVTAQCEVATNTSVIIKKKESLAHGAQFLRLYEDIESNDACSDLCCKNVSCDMALFENKGDHYCYLFQCGGNCIYSHHSDYIKNDIIHRSPQQPPSGDGSEQDLIDLDAGPDFSKNKDDNSLKTVPATVTPLSTTSAANIRAHSVGLEGPYCELDVHCEDPEAVCNYHTCRCRDGYYKKGPICRQVCPPSNFECLELGTLGRGPQCVTEMQVCDSIMQCADGSDEFNCPDSGAPPIRTWQKQQQLQPQAEPVPQQNPQQSHPQQQTFPQSQQDYVNPGSSRLAQSGEQGSPQDFVRQGQNVGQGDLPHYPDYSSQQQVEPQQLQSQQIQNPGQSMPGPQQAPPQALHPNLKIGFSSGNKGYIGNVAMNSGTLPQQLASADQQPSAVGNQQSYQNAKLPGQPPLLQLQPFQNPVKQQPGNQQFPQSSQQTFEKSLPKQSNSKMSSNQVYEKLSPQQPYKDSQNLYEGQESNQPYKISAPKGYQPGGSQQYPPTQGQQALQSAPDSRRPSNSAQSVSEQEVPRQKVIFSDGGGAVQSNINTQNQQAAPVQQDSKHQVLAQPQVNPQAVDPKSGHLAQPKPPPKATAVAEAHPQDHPTDPSLGMVASQKSYVVPGKTQNNPDSVYRPSLAKDIPEQPHPHSAYDVRIGEPNVPHRKTDVEQKSFLNPTDLSDLDVQEPSHFLGGFGDQYLPQQTFGKQYSPYNRYPSAYQQNSGIRGSGYPGLSEQLYPGSQGQRVYPQQSYMDFGYPASQFEFGEFDPPYPESENYPGSHDLPDYRPGSRLGYEGSYKGYGALDKDQKPTEKDDGLVNENPKQDFSNADDKAAQPPKVKPSTEKDNSDETADSDTDTNKSSDNTDYSDDSSSNDVPASKPDADSQEETGGNSDHNSLDKSDDKDTPSNSDGTSKEEAVKGDSSNKFNKQEEKGKKKESEVDELLKSQDEFIFKQRVTMHTLPTSMQGPIIALSLGLAFTVILLIFVACRLRTVRHRLRKGRPLHSNEADYLINGMYL